MGIGEVGNFLLENQKVRGGAGASWEVLSGYSLNEEKITAF